MQAIVLRRHRRAMLSGAIQETEEVMSSKVPMAASARQSGLLDALRTHFGCCFELSEFCCSASLDELDSQHLPDVAIQALQELSDSTTAHSITMQNQQTLLTVAWCDGYSNWVGFAPVTSSDSDLLDLLVQGWFRERKLDTESSDLLSLSRELTQQVSRGFEELSFSRQIAAALTACDASHEMPMLAEMILGDLRRTIQAGVVALVVPTQCDASYQIAVRDGGAKISDHAVLQCVKRYGPASAFEPFVFNGEIASSDSISIRGAVIVCVRKGEDIAGWLVALNPVDRRSSYAGSELEFGSFEAGLMESAASFLSSQARNASLIQELENIVTSVVRVLVSTIEAKDPYTRGHSERVAEYARILSNEMGASEEEADRAHFTGLLHDIGKIGIPDAILQKTDRLTAEEFGTVKSHPVVGWEILKVIDSLAYVEAGVLFHHERFDGTGYPSGLAGEDIPLMGRIMSVADAFDAMTSNRSYRQGMPVEKVREIFREGAGTQWDPQVVQALQKAMPDILAVAGLATA
jgi:HD-GYP domain-containing protein (c-di-GMP phosphodiesterase class II)